jgi:hypothetical protein
VISPYFEFEMIEKNNISSKAYSISFLKKLLEIKKLKKIISGKSFSLKQSYMT